MANKGRTEPGEGPGSFGAALDQILGFEPKSGPIRGTDQPK